MNEKPSQTAVPTPFLSEDEIALLKRTLLVKFPEDQQLTFVRICQRTKLDPFVKQIYPTTRYTKIGKGQDAERVATLVTVTGIMGLCALAERTGNYDGCIMAWSGKDGVWRPEWLSDEFPEAARCTVFHKQRTHPEIGIARWGGFAGQIYNYQSKQWELSDFWIRMPEYMLGKCAKALALRGAFPDQMSNVYIREELDSNITDAEETEQLPADEAKYTAARAREAKDKLEHPEEYVTSGPAQETAAQVTEEAFEEDKVPPKPVAPPPVAAGPHEPAAAPATADDIPFPPEPQAEPPWKTHVILGLRHPKYFKKMIGELGLMPDPASPVGDLKTLEDQWIPQVRKKWAEASEEQKQDVNMLEAALAYYKMAKPW